MAEFAALYKRRGCVVEEQLALLKERDNAAVQEARAAANMQRMYRGKVARDRWRTMSAAVTEIARMYKGHLDRRKVKRLAKVKKDHQAAAIFHYHARNIQRIFRGHTSRKYRYNHARRKAYLRDVVKVGEELRLMLIEHENTMRATETALEEEKRTAELAKVSENLHHLVSTKACPGVFNSPYITQERLPTINGVPVDQHLCSSVKDLLRSRGYIKKGLAPDLNGTLRIPMTGPLSRRTLQASDPYDLQRECAKAAAVQARLKLLGPREFRAGETVHQKPYKRGISEGCGYTETWENPYLARGVPESTAELKLPFTQTSMARRPAQPFHTSVGGNRSAVLPNGLFDVILESQSSGGVLGRHLSSTRRRGVPDTCDVIDSSLEDLKAGRTIYPPSPPRSKIITHQQETSPQSAQRRESVSTSAE